MFPSRAAASWCRRTMGSFSSTPQTPTPAARNWATARLRSAGFFISATAPSSARATLSFYISGPGFVAQGANSAYSIFNAWVWGQSGEHQSRRHRGGRDLRRAVGERLYSHTRFQRGHEQCGHHLRHHQRDGGHFHGLSQSPATIIKLTGSNTYTGKATLPCGSTYAITLNSVSSPAPSADVVEFRQTIKQR